MIIGLTNLFTKLALQVADPIDTLAARFTAAFFAIAIPAAAGWVKVNWRSRNWLPLLPVGLLYPVAFFGFASYGLTYMTASEASMFQATAPIFTLILAALILKEHSTLLQKLAVLSSVCGVIVILVMGGLVGFVAIALVSAMYGIFRQVNV